MHINEGTETEDDAIGKHEIIIATYVINTLTRACIFIGVAILIKNMYDKIEVTDESLWNFTLKTVAYLQWGLVGHVPH